MLYIVNLEVFCESFSFNVLDAGYSILDAR